MMTIPTCNLCHPSKGLIARAPFWTTVLNVNQTLLGRCHFTLNRHETDAANLTSGEQIDLFERIRETKLALDALFHPDHYNYVLLMNIEPHVHAHIIPRYKSERQFGAETFLDGHFGAHYDPAAEKFLGDETFDALAEAIHGAIAARKGTGI